jgi:hypothetical protein
VTIQIYRVLIAYLMEATDGNSRILWKSIIG